MERFYVVQTKRIKKIFRVLKRKMLISQVLIQVGKQIEDYCL